ncbi:hypothetical protein GTQ34_03330 [Muricauda sp. JGD-17]|uniref:Lipocalin-like domain-containing protein n=1 Tax=Flagellimonas ochracea TaxID=2696472 RepID=A0A964WWE1_9FLAO|nr:hypothetical protein [Allomuricauda ochracea]NAY90941.1 hypothetical protein [Allomuricauda ochracea]
MKNPIKVSFLLTAVFLLMSCSSDDNGSTQPTINFSVIGIWDLVEVNVSSAQDIDLDGTPSSNLVEELPCISGTLLIDADFSWTFEQSDVAITGITGGLFFAQCSGTTSATGTWTANDTEVLFQGSSQLESLRISGETLVNNIDEDLPGIGSFVYARRQ